MVINATYCPVDRPPYRVRSLRRMGGLEIVHARNNAGVRLTLNKARIHLGLDCNCITLLETETRMRADAFHNTPGEITEKLAAADAESAKLYEIINDSAR